MRLQLVLTQELVQQLTLLGKPLTLMVGSPNQDVDHNVLMAAINYVRLVGRVCLHAEFVPHHGTKTVFEQTVKGILALHQCSPGELVLERINPEGGESPFFARYDLICTDHPTQRNRPKQDTPAAADATGRG